MDVFFWGADRAGSVSALLYLISNANVTGCSCDHAELDNPISEICNNNNIPVYTSEELLTAIKENYITKPAWGICYSFHSLIPKALISFPLYGIINFHPSPLPDHRGIAGASYAKYYDNNEWGVSVHYMDENFDTGDIIAVNKFEIDNSVSAIVLDDIIQHRMLTLYKNVVDSILTGIIPQRAKQQRNEGRYYSRKALVADKKINLSDNAETINRKIEAFWFPPFEGAYIEIAEERYTLLNNHILKELSALYSVHFSKGWNLNTNNINRGGGGYNVIIIAVVFPFIYIYAVREKTVKPEGNI
jgi:methionyl-tRNA formyltransferase